MLSVKIFRWQIQLIAVSVLGAVSIEAQVDYGTRLGIQQGEANLRLPQGPEPLLNSVNPSTRRWYVPQELYEERQWRQWHASSYAREPYQRYVNTSLEGEHFYDLYGNFLNRGWLIYNVSQSNPSEFGSVLYKAQRFRGWFSEVAIAAEQKGQYAYALTISSDLRTTITPMVLSKPRMDGVQFDFSTDKYRGTLLYSQANAPRGITTRELRRTNSTTLLGGRFEVQVGDFLELGVHGVNAHQANSLSEEALLSNWVTGSLTQGQNKTISEVVIVLRDDSPEDGVSGAAYFPAGSDVLITYRDGQVDSGRDIRFEPIVEGGAPGPGFIEASGNDRILLRYDFDSADFLNRASADKTEITKVEFRLVVANDYQVWMGSDRRTGGAQVSVVGSWDGSVSETTDDGSVGRVYGLVASAAGNVQDLSNLRVLGFEAGLPTATHILGGTFALDGLMGFDVYGEYDLNWNYSKYPNVLEEIHETSAGRIGERSVPAWMLSASRNGSKFFAYGEAYSMDPMYNTRTYVTDDNGNIDYQSDRSLLDLVEDNDDQDRVPDSFRADWAFPDRQVFPGWDTNNDFVPDINQNDSRVRANTVPDYDEPFLRFSVDRPEFLFGVDMNNNFWVDQYENDVEPDYPYDRDHRGFNVYGGMYLAPDIKILAGTLREGHISSDKKNHSIYALLRLDAQSASHGDFRIFGMSRMVQDDIEDAILQWKPDNTLRLGSLTAVEDPLLARDTWVNQVYVGHNFYLSGVQLQTKLHWLSFRQMMSSAQLQRYGLAERDHFFGIINKASKRANIGRFWIEPRWKSEYIHQTRDLFSANDRHTLQELFSLLGGTEALSVTRLQLGVEYVTFRDFREAANEFKSLTGAIQFKNESAYLGYRLQTVVGLAVERKTFRGAPARAETQSFIAVYAGL